MKKKMSGYERRNLKVDEENNQRLLLEKIPSLTRFFKPKVNYSATNDKETIGNQGEIQELEAIQPQELEDMPPQEK